MTAEKPVASKDDSQRILEVFLSQVKGASKTSGADILRKVFEDVGKVHAVADVKAPLNFSVMHVVCDFYTSIGYDDLANLDRGMVNMMEQFSVAQGGKRVKDVLEALKSVLTQEFEIQKSAAKRAFP